MYLFFDTETTGKYIFGMPPDNEKQPNICQIAAILVDENRKVAAEMNMLVHPDGKWECSPEVVAIHGITTERCKQYGLSLVDILETFDVFVAMSKVIVAHNIEFDANMMTVSHLRAYEDDWNTHTFDKTLRCTMKESTDVCKLPGRRGFKWPRLQEAYKHFFGAEFEDAHDAMADVKACMRVFFALEDLKKGGTDVQNASNGETASQ